MRPPAARSSSAAVGGRRAGHARLVPAVPEHHRVRRQPGGERRHRVEHLRRRPRPPDRSSPASARPVSVACTCASTNAGVTSAPSRSTTRSAAGASASGAEPGDRARRRPAGRSRADRPGCRRARRGTGSARGLPVRAPSRTQSCRQPGLEQRAHRRLAAHQIQRELRVAGHVPVADQHGHVRGQPLGAQRGGGETRRHREEDHRAAVGGGQDRAVLAAGHVHADHGDVGRPAQRRGHRRGQRHRVAGVGEHHRRRPGRPATSRSRSAALGTTPTVRRRRPAGPRPATATALARAADHRAPVRRRRSRRRRTRAVSAGAPHTSSTARASSGSRSSGSTAAIERANRIACPAHGTCSLRPVPAGQAVGDRQRGEGQRHQRGDPVAGLEPQRRGRADLVDGADEHAARAGDRVVHLAAAGR